MSAPLGPEPTTTGPDAVGRTDDEGYGFAGIRIHAYSSRSVTHKSANLATLAEGVEIIARGNYDRVSIMDHDTMEHTLYVPTGARLFTYGALR